MNFIATVNTPAHGHISVTFSENEKSVLDAWRDNVTIELSGKEKQQITSPAIARRSRPRHDKIIHALKRCKTRYNVFFIVGNGYVPPHIKTR